MNNLRIYTNLSIRTPNVTCPDENQLVIVNKYCYFPKILTSLSGQVTRKATCPGANSTHHELVEELQDIH